MNRPLRDEIATACRILASRGLAHDVIGHVSARDPSETEVMWIRCRAPEERGLIHTKTNAIRRTSISGAGNVDDGYELPLESPIHSCIYAVRPDVQAVVHAHPPFAVLCGIAGVQLLPVYAGFESDGMLLAHDGIPTFERSRHISDREIGAEMATALSDRNALILRGHGIVTVGKSVPDALLNAIRLERLAWIHWQLKLAGCDPDRVRTSQDDITFFARTNRVEMTEATKRRWDAYASDVRSSTARTN